VTRHGTNPLKLDGQLAAFKRHRIIMPVHVPNRDGYFRHAVEILKLSLDSLSFTTGDRASLTVIANGCIPEVRALLREYFEAGKIDQVLFNNRNWGKIDAVLSMLFGRFEPFMTVTDSDVLFLPGWLQAIEETFRRFPECGFATPAPNPSLAFVHTASTILSALATRELQFERVVPDEDLERFAHSIGRPDYVKPQHRLAQMTVRRGGFSACVGGGHFVFTLRREVIASIPRRPSLSALKPLGETAWFDDPPDAAGAWRLSTTRAYAHHMGNVPEPWMYELIEQCRTSTVGQWDDSPFSALSPSRVSMLPLSWRKLAVAAIRKVQLEPRWLRLSTANA